MIASLGPRLLEAYQNPRGSARRILAATPTRGEAMTMVAAGAVLNVLAASLAEVMTGVSVQSVLVDLANQSADRSVELTPVNPVGLTLERLVQSFGFFLTAALLAFWFGSRAGGRADGSAMLAMAGWWAIVWAPANLAATLALLMLGAANFTAAVGLNFGLELIMLFLFASFVSEAHGFANAGRVMAASLGILFVAALLLSFVALFAGLSGGALPSGV